MKVKRARLVFDVDLDEEVDAALLVSAFARAICSPGTPVPRGRMAVTAFQPIETLAAPIDLATLAEVKVWN